MKRSTSCLRITGRRIIARRFIGHQIIGLLLITGLAIVGCGRGAPERSSASSSGPDAAGTPQVLVVNYPLYFFAAWIAGDAAEVIFPAPENVDPDFWRPSSEVIEQYQQADLILVNGASFGRWLDRVSLPESRLKNTSASFRDEYITLPDAIVHQHGPEGEHAHEGLASHTWLGPELARQQAQAVRDALVELVPDRADFFQQQWQALDRDLGELEDQFRRLGDDYPEQALYASHPLYDYLARFCGWNLKNYHWEPHETPADRQWERFADQHPEHEARIMIWEATPTPETEQRLRDEFQVISVPFHTLANRPADGDYLTVMQTNLAGLRQALEAVADSASE
jgi:zinc transport system substrate-binding protein